MDGWWSRGGACARLTCCSPWRRRSGRWRVVKQFVSALLPFSLPRCVQVQCATKHTGKPQRTVLRLPCFAMWSCRRRSPVVLQWLVSAVVRRTVGVGIKLIKLCLREGVGRLELPVSFWGFTACLMTSGGVLTFSGSKRPLPIQVGPHVLASTLGSVAVSHQSGAGAWFARASSAATNCISLRSPWHSLAFWPRLHNSARASHFFTVYRPNLPSLATTNLTVDHDW